MDKLKCFFKYLMETPDVNSRFIFLLQGLTHVLGVLILTVAFICVKNKEPYPTMVLAVAGGGAGAAVGRWATKKAGDGKTADASAEVTVPEGGSPPQD